MKKIMNSIKVLSVVGVLALNINPLYACLPHLECDGDDGGIGAGRVTCYSTWDTGGSTTIHKCGLCIEQENTTNARDQGKC